MPWQELVAVTVIATFVAAIAGGLMENRVRKLLEARDEARQAREEKGEEVSGAALAKIREDLAKLSERVTVQETRLDTYLELVKRSGTRLLKDMIG